MSEIKIPSPNNSHLTFFKDEKSKQTSMPKSDQSEELQEEVHENVEAKKTEKRLTGKSEANVIEELHTETAEKLDEKPAKDKDKEKEEIPLMLSSVNELQEISLALIYYKTYLKNKGQKEKAEQIGEIDHKIFQTIQSARNSSSL